MTSHVSWNLWNACSEAGRRVGGGEPLPGHGDEEGEEHLGVGLPLSVHVQGGEPAAAQRLREHEVEPADARHWRGERETVGRCELSETKAHHAESHYCASAVAEGAWNLRSGAWCP